MRVLLYAPFLAMGGVETHMLYLARALRAAGHYTAIAAKGPHDFAFVRDRIDVHRTVPVHYLGDLPAHQLRAQWRLLEQDIRPDIINVQLPIGQAEREAMQAPVVATYHGRYSAAGAVAARAHVCLDHRYWDATRVVAMNSATRGLMFRLWNGVELDQFPYTPNTGGRLPRLLYVGRIMDLKLLALRAVWEHLPADVYGDRPGIEDLKAGAPPPPSTANLFGPVQPQDVFPHYRLATCTGISALEAMAMGQPMLYPFTLDVCLPLLRASSYAVATVYPEGRGALEDARRLWHNPEALERGQTICRAWVCQFHDARDMARDFIRVYERVTA